MFRDNFGCHNWYLMSRPGMLLINLQCIGSSLQQKIIPLKMATVQRLRNSGLEKEFLGARYGRVD